VLSRAVLPDFERQRREDMDYIRSTGYWDIKEKLAERMGFANEWQEYRAATKEGKEDFGTVTDPNMSHRDFRKFVMGSESSIRMRMRADNKTLQDTLLKYGFVKREYDYLKDIRTIGRASQDLVLQGALERQRRSR